MSRRFHLPPLAVILLLGFAGSLHAQIVTYTWISRNDYGYLEDAENWLGGVAPAEDILNTRLVFGPATRGDVYFYEILAHQLKIDGIVRPVELYGSYDTTNLGGGGIIYAPAGDITSYLDDYIQLHASQTWNIQSGTFVIEGAISDANSNYSITKTGAGMLVLDTYDSYGWTGGLTLNEGRLGVTSSTGYSEGLGQGVLTINGGTLVALDPYDWDDQIPLYNDILINGTLTTENQAELRLGYSGDDESTITMDTDVTIRSSGEPLFLTGHITDNEQARKLTIDSTGAVIIDGPTSYTGGTEVTKGILVFAGEDNVPSTGQIKIGSLGYAGISTGQNVGGFLGQIDAANSTGTIGFDSDPEYQNGDTFTSPIDLTGFNPLVRLGSATSAVLGYSQEPSSATITPQGTSYRFGGGGGFLEVQTPLVDLSGPTVVRNVVLDSPAPLPLTVSFTSTENDFSGGVSATHSAAMFTVGSFPETGTLTLGDGGYIGLVEVNMIDADNPAQDFINRFATTTDRGMIGFDATGEHVTITDPISLAGFSDASPGIYLGTHSWAHLNGPITPQGSTYRFGAYKGGELTVNAQLTGAGNSVHIGDPNSLGTMGDFNEEQYSRVILAGDNSYDGTTTLYTGELLIGQSNGAVGTDPTTALGTGALIVQPHTLTLPPGRDDVRPQISSWDSLIIPNALQVNADVNIYGYESTLTFTGNITGNGEIYTEGALNLTLAGNNAGFSGGIYLSGYTTLNLANDTAAGTGPLGFGYSSNLQVIFESAAPVLGGLYSNDYYGGEGGDYAELRATQPDTVLTINQASDGFFNGEFRHDADYGALRVVKEGAGTLRLNDGGLYVYNGVPEPTLDNAEVTLQVNAGTLVIDGSFYLGQTNSSYPGNEPAITPTTVWVNGGTLAVDNWGAVGNPLVITSGALAGTGHFNTATIGANATLTPGLPGDPIGHLDFADLTLAPQGTLEWNVRTADPLAGDHDLVSISSYSTLHITAGVNVEDRFTLKLVSLQANGTPGVLTGLSGDRSYTWTIFDATYSSIDGFDPEKFIIDASLFFTDLPIATLELWQDENLIQLTFQPVPEPSTYMMILSGLALIGLGYRRKLARARRGA